MGELFDAAKEVLKVSIDQKQNDFMERIYEALKQGKKHLEIQMGDCSESYVKMFVKWLSDEGFSATHGSESPRPPMILFRLCVNLEPFYTQPEPAKDADPELITDDAQSNTRILVMDFPQKGAFHRILDAAGLNIEVCTFDGKGKIGAKFIENVDYDVEVDGNDVILSPTLNSSICGTVVVRVKPIYPGLSA